MLEKVRAAFQSVPNGVDIHGTNFANAQSIERHGLRSPWSVHIELASVKDPLDFINTLRTDRTFGSALGLASFAAKKNSVNFEPDLLSGSTTPAIVVFSPLKKSLVNGRYFSKQEETGFVPREKIIGIFPIPPFNPAESGNYQVFKQVIREMVKSGLFSL